MTRRAAPIQGATFARPISATTLDARMSDHELWLASNKVSGKRLELEDVIIANLSLEGRALSGCHLRHVAIDGGRMAHACLDGATFDRVQFTNCDLTGSNLEATYFADCFTADSPSCWAGAKLGHATLRRCAIRGGIFAGGVLRKAAIEFSDFRGCDFSGATLTKANIYHSDLRGSSFVGAYAHTLRVSKARMGGCLGVPHWHETMEIHDVDISPAGDGSRLLGYDMVDALAAEFLAAEDEHRKRQPQS